MYQVLVGNIAVVFPFVSASWPRPGFLMENKCIEACFERDWIRANPQEYNCSAWKNAWIRR